MAAKDTITDYLPADPAASSHRPWILFDALAHIGDRPNDTTAEGFTSNNKAIKVSFWPADPPAPSHLFVYCPDEDLFEAPRILCSAGGFLLLRLRYCTTPRAEKGDYFIYRAGRTPLLKLLPKPQLLFQDSEVGLLPRGEHVTVAALSFYVHGRTSKYALQVLDSKFCTSWTIFDDVPVVAPQRAFQIPIPDSANRLHHHSTTTVITLGGEGGTMGWADLYRGILFCDVLRDRPTLRGVPVPLPVPLVRNGRGIDGCPDPHRGIAVDAQGHLRIVEMYVHSDYDDLARDSGTGCLNFSIRDWELLVYTNSKITGAWEDWQLEHTVRASAMEVGNAMHWQLVQSGLLRDCKALQKEGLPKELQNLHTSQPIFDLDDKGTVYLLTRLQFRHPKEWVLAVDMKHNRIQAVAEFGFRRCLGVPPAYRPSRISCYMKASTAPATGGNLGLLGESIHEVVKDGVLQI